ncbi:hypothetical protein C8Q75DRAFT_95652 [Abortiporus biennis]|nr:hypothetical protein C8Q75DRAFT_95652 [Abortiporus biennis]
MGATATAESDGSFAVPGLPHPELAYPSSYAQAFGYDSQCTPMDTSGSESFIQHSAAQYSLAHASPTRPLGIVSQSISHTPEGHSLAATIPTPQSILPSCNIKQLNDDSESLPANPDDAISFLVDTASNALSRDKWMVLAGQYRMNGNTEAAIAVLSAMIHVMISPTVGLPEGELKPIFLMLSSCHTEIWKRIRVNGPSEISKMHFEKAKTYLQAVYGTNTPQLSAPSEMLRVRSKSGLNSKYIRESTDSFNMKEQVPQVESPSDSGHIKSLEKEIDTLRDRQSTQKTCLAQVRGAKRKLEEDLSLEKRSRRKLERELDTVIQELSGARRGEKYALEQCRREVENRRKAEERVVVLKEEIKEVRRSAAEFEDAALLRDRRSREIFGAVGIACMRAAKGEFIWETSASGNGSNAHEE